MPNCIVVSFRGAMPADTAGGARYLERALRVKKRAEAHGATLCAWSAWTFSFTFEPDELEEAVNLSSLAPEGPDEGFGVGIAEGAMSPVGERGPLSGLMWGLPLVTASALSRAARGGEVLVDEPFFNAREAELADLGFMGEGDRIRRLVRADGTSEMRASRVSLPPPPLPQVQRESSPAPPVSARQPDQPAGRPRAGRDDPRVEGAKKALLQGDVAALERLITELRETGEHGDLVERMSGFVALRRGATADALRRLRAAAEAVKEPAQRARARLAYGVALASAGRTDSALLEALEALARAREARDLHGEHACALFLARLSAAAGHADAASVWAVVATRAEALS